jgi:hypothetical protein
VNTTTRRDFLKLFGLGAAGATLSVAGLFDDELVELVELDLRPAKRTKATPAAKTRN